MDATEIIRFAFALNDAEEFDAVEDVMEYLKRPSLWEDEFDAWRQLGSPRPGDRKWDDFMDIMEQREDA